MVIIIMFLTVLIILIILRTIKLNYNLKKKSKSTSNKSIILNRVFNFIKKEIRFVIYLYIALVGIYVVMERMFKYNIYPANLKNINQTLSIIHDINTNQFISLIYLLLICIYVMFFLPYRLLKLYNEIIKDTNSKDYIHSFIVTNFNKIEKKAKTKK